MKVMMWVVCVIGGVCGVVLMNKVMRCCRRESRRRRVAASERAT